MVCYYAVGKKMEQLNCNQRFFLLFSVFPPEPDGVNDDADPKNHEGVP